MTPRLAPCPIALSLLLSLPLGACTSEATPPPKSAAKDSAAAADGATPPADDAPAADDAAPAAEGTPTPAAPDRPFDQLSTPEKAEVMVSTVEQLGALHQKNAEDCPALAKAIEGFHAEHGDAMANSPPDVNAHIDGDEAMRSRVRAAMKKVMEASMGCSKDPAFKEMQARVFGSKAQPPPPPPSDAAANAD